MNLSDKRRLSERQMQLLERFHDGECRWFGEIQARGLVQRNREAREFLEALQRIAGDVKLEQRSIESCDLWSRISARIEAEEQGQRWLGVRQFKGADGREKVGWFGFGGSRERFAWGASGAVFASLCSAVLIQFGLIGAQGPGGLPSTPNFSSNQSLASQQVGAAPLVSSVGYGTVDGFSSDDQFIPVLQARNVPRRLSGSATGSAPVEVDWVRSEGRLRLLQDPDERSAIIWVKRPSGRPEMVSGQPRLSRRANRSSIPIAIPVAGR